MADTLIHLSAPKLDISGISTPSVHKWLGIPYATAGRWERPRAIEQNAWEGVRACTEYGPIPPQAVPSNNYFGYGGDVREWVKNMSEDCLSINVFKPAVQEDELPVMVYIYGGGFENGSSRFPQQDGTELAKVSMSEGKPTIQVSFNYRLNIFGFLALTELEEVDPDGLTGNYGLYDQIAALQWVQSNIRAFGGDIDNVTVFGESAGAISIAAIISRSNPCNERLFNRAILLSGFWGIGMFHRVQQVDLTPMGIGREDRTAIQKIQQLKGLSWQELLEKKDLLYPSVPLHWSYWPVVENSSKGRWGVETLVVLKEGKTDPQCFEIILGVTRDEGSVFAPAVRTLSQYDAYISTLPQIIQPIVRDMYGAPPQDDQLALSTPQKDAPGAKIMSDRFFGSLWISLRKLCTIPNIYQGSKPTVYVFGLESAFETKAPYPSEVGVAHAMDVGLVYGFKECWGNDHNSSSAKVGQEMQRRFLTFAKEGCPGEDWPALDNIFPFFETHKRLLFQNDGKTSLQVFSEWRSKERRQWSDWYDQGLFLQ